jgi:dUTP pyrophosphatase
MDKLKIYVEDKEFLPVRAHETDAGLDLKITSDIDLWSGVVTKAGTGVHVAIPRGYMGIVALRSSLGARGITIPNGVGIIDSDFRGQIHVTLSCSGDAVLKRGERVAQLIIVPIETPAVECVKSIDDLGATERGSDGFGSTGK